MQEIRLLSFVNENVKKQGENVGLGERSALSLLDVRVAAVRG